jgi:predicted permease
MGLLVTLAGTVLPVFLLAGVGALARLKLVSDPRPISRIAIYVFTPALIFESILRSRLGSGQVVTIVVFALLLTLATSALMAAATLLFRWDRRQSSAAQIASLFMNVANYGLPVNLFAFGRAGFDRAAVFVVVMSLLVYSLGVFLAARGRMPYSTALLAILRLPLLWAALIALLLRLSGVPLPDVLAKSLTLLASGALPLIVVLLGLQVGGIRVTGERLRIALVTLVRLVISPLVALGIVALLDPEPLTAKVLVVESAMPTAVNTVLLAAEFDADPDVVASICLVSTALSLGTVTFWVWFLR